MTEKDAIMGTVTHLPVNTADASLVEVITSNLNGITLGYRVGGFGRAS